LTFRLSSRCLDILNQLAASEQPVPSVEIARKLNISSRMVRSSLMASEQWLREEHITLKRVPGIGFSLLGSEEARKNLTRIIRAYDQPYPWLSPTERLHVLLLSLLFTEKPIQIKQLQQTLNLSRTTTLRVMDLSENWLRDYHLELIRRPNYGCKIGGNERNWREAAVNLLQESAGDARLLTLFQGINTVVDSTGRMKTRLEETLQKIWIQLDIPLIIKLNSRIAHEFDWTLSDQAFIKFYIYLAVVIYRNKSGNSTAAFPEKSVVPHLSKAKKLADRVQENFAVMLPETEIAWLALLMPEAGAPSPELDRSGTGINIESAASLQRIIDQILAQAALALHPGLSTDVDLIRNLTLQVETILDPQIRGQTSRNPLLRDVKSQYPYIYSVARQSSFILTARLGRELSEAEIGDIAICFIASMERWRLSEKQRKKVLVVCTAGVVTAWLLVSRLRAEFPDVEVVEVISALELEGRKTFEGIEFIVSTVPLKIKYIPSRQVNPLLGWEDCKALKELFEENGNINSEKRPILPKTRHLADLITPERIELGVAAKNWQEVVEKAGARLLETNAIEAQFIQAMKNIILEYGPYMVIWPGAVLLHAPPRGVRHLCMQLITLREPVNFGHPENDPVQMAIVLGAVDSHAHVTALLELNQLMQDEKARIAFKSTQHKSVILHWVGRYSNSTEM
jgi:mannitol operon transcriptional antiterminator